MSIPRITQGLTAVALLLTLTLPLAGCGGGGGAHEASDTQLSGASTESTAVTEAGAPASDAYGRDIVNADVPASLGFDGRELRVFSRNTDGFEYEFCAEEENGEIINDTVLLRNRYVEEALDTVIVNKAQPLDSGGNDMKQLISSITAGEDSFDIAAIHSSQGAVYAADGYFMNLLDIPYIDFDKPWWNSDFADELTVGGFLPMALGDASLSSVMYTVVTFYNAKLYSEYYSENIYNTVKDGKWTLDLLGEMTKDIYRDLDGDGTLGANDFYALGFMSAATPLDAFIAALDLSITKRDGDGLPYLAFSGERTVSAFEKLRRLVTESPGTLTNPRSTATKANAEFREKFIGGQLIFNFTNIYETEYYREMEDDYGVLPLPKYDEAQLSYYTLPHNSFSVLTVAKTCTAKELAGAALELFCEQSYKTVIPVYYETALKQKYFRDDESSQMFDIVMDGIRLNFGSVYQTKMINQVGWLIRDLSKDFTSTYAANESKYEAAMAGLLEKLSLLK